MTDTKREQSVNADSTKGPRKGGVCRIGGVTQHEYRWIERVCQGESFEDALGSDLATLPKRKREQRVIKMIETPAVRTRLIQGLLLVGRNELALKVLHWPAIRTLEAALAEGDDKAMNRAKLALSLVQGSARVTPRKGKGPASPALPATGRTLD